MDQYLENRQKQILWNLLANPADTGRLYATNLAQMVNDHPQSGLLQVLLARAGEGQEVKNPAVYFKAGTLHKLLHSPDSLQAVPADRIISPGKAHPLNFVAAPLEEAPAEAPAHEELVNVPAELQEPEAEAISHEPETFENKPAETTAVEESEHAEPWVANEAANADLPQAEATSTAIDDEQYDEIREVDAIIPELYQAYEEQLANPQNSETPANAPVDAEPHDEIIPELYHAYEGQAAHANSEVSVEEPLTVEAAKSEDPYGQTTDTRVETLTQAEPDAPVNTVSQDANQEYFRQDIEDDIYDEIVGIDDIGFHPVVNVLHEAELTGDELPADEAAPQNTLHTPYADDEDYPQDEEEADERPLPKPAGLTDQDIGIDEEKLILGNIVSADYLFFDKKLDELRNTDNGSVQQPAALAGAGEQATEEPLKDNQDVSRYNDDKMPYSFMWWLDKTRREHAERLQPYAASPEQEVVNNAEHAPAAESVEQQRVKPVHRKAPDELQQQYYENIFSLTSVSGIDRDDPKFDHSKKEDVIIERFITTEPQIRPPAADRLDNENKAKKSAEDQDALVTETLARIYIDQMLYHKAIATYKKLMLKFPEKKLYFATQIEQLEKKTN